MIFNKILINTYILIMLNSLNCSEIFKYLNDDKESNTSLKSLYSSNSDVNDYIFPFCNHVFTSKMDQLQQLDNAIYKIFSHNNNSEIEDNEDYNNNVQENLDIIKQYNNILNNNKKESNDNNIIQKNLYNIIQNNTQENQDNNNIIQKYWNNINNDKNISNNNQAIQNNNNIIQENQNNIFSNNQTGQNNINKYNILLKNIQCHLENMESFIKNNNNIIHPNYLLNKVIELQHNSEELNYLKNQLQLINLKLHNVELFTNIHKQNEVIEIRIKQNVLSNIFKYTFTNNNYTMLKNLLNIINLINNNNNIKNYLIYCFNDFIDNIIYGNINGLIKNNFKYFFKYVNKNYSNFVKETLSSNQEVKYNITTQEILDIMDNTSINSDDDKLIAILFNDMIEHKLIFQKDYYTVTAKNKNMFNENNYLLMEKKEFLRFQNIFLIILSDQLIPDIYKSNILRYFLCILKNYIWKNIGNDISNHFFFNDLLRFTNEEIFYMTLDIIDEFKNIAYYSEYEHILCKYSINNLLINLLFNDNFINTNNENIISKRKKIINDLIKDILKNKNTAENLFKILNDNYESKYIKKFIDEIINSAILQDTDTNEVEQNNKKLSNIDYIVNSKQTNDINEIEIKQYIGNIIVNLNVLNNNVKDLFKNSLLILLSKSNEKNNYNINSLSSENYNKNKQDMNNLLLENNNENIRNVNAEKYINVLLHYFNTNDYYKINNKSETSINSDDNILTEKRINNKLNINNNENNMIIEDKTNNILNIDNNGNNMIIERSNVANIEIGNKKDTSTENNNINYSINSNSEKNMLNNNGKNGINNMLKKYNASNNNDAINVSNISINNENDINDMLIKNNTLSNNKNTTNNIADNNNEDNIYSLFEENNVKNLKSLVKFINKNTKYNKTIINDIIDDAIDRKIFENELKTNYKKKYRKNFINNFIFKLNRNAYKTFNEIIQDRLYVNKKDKQKYVIYNNIKESINNERNMLLNSKK